MRWFLLLILACVGCARSRLGSSPESMRSWARDELAKQLPAWTIADGDEPLVLNLSHGERQLEVWLGRPFEHCQNNPSDCESTAKDYLQTVTRAATDMQSPTPSDASQLMPAVRSLAAVEAYKTRAEGVLADPIAGDLFVVYMLDSPRMAAVVDANTLAELHLSAEQAKQRAFENFRGQHPTIETLVRPEPGAKVGVVNLGHYYTSSLIVPHAGWSEVARRCEGPLLVAVPTPELLQFACEREPSALPRLLQAARESFTRSPQGTSASVLRWTPSGWTLASTP